MSYSIQFKPILEDDSAEWEGGAEVSLLVDKDPGFTESSHNYIVSFMHRMSMIGRFWEDNTDEFERFNEWYATQMGTNVNVKELN